MSEILRCVQPDQVLDEDYLAVLDSNPRPSFSQHLQSCLFCQNELAAYRKLDIAIHQDFSFITSSERVLCPSSQKLGEFALDLLVAVERNQVTNHLANCPYCPAELTALSGWVLADDPLLGKVAVAPLSGLRRIIAILLNQAGTTPGYALAGVRGDSEKLPRNYQAEEVSVTLTIQTVAPRSRDLLVMGLVQRDNYPMDATAGAQVRLSEGGHILATEIIDELGNFVFEQITAPEHFDLEITLDDKIVMVPNLALN